MAGRLGALVFTGLVLAPVMLGFWPAARAGVPDPPVQGLFPLVVFSPLLWALLLSGRTSMAKGDEGGGLFHNLRPAPGMGRWVLASLACFPVLSLAAIAIGALAFDSHPTWPVSGGTFVLVDFLQFLLVAPLLLLIPCLAEEPGWRGFLQPRMSRWLGPLAGSIVIGVVWGVWHSTDLVMHADHFPDLASYAPKFTWIVGASILFGWFYHRSGGSLLSAMAAHTGGNLAFALTPISPWNGYHGRTFQVLLGLVFGLGLILMLLAPPRLAKPGCVADGPAGSA